MIGTHILGTPALPYVSVAICTRDRPGLLERSLLSVLANDYDNFDVTVVDQSSTNETETVVKAIRDSKLAYVRACARGLSAARNAAVQRTRGAVLAFTDDDCIVSPQWVARIAHIFSQDTEVGLLFGAFHPAPHDPNEYFVPSFVPTRYRRLKGIWATRCNDSEGGGNMAIRRTVFDAVGPFDLCLGAGASLFSGEDSDFNYRTLRAGFAVVHDPESIVVHWGMRAYADGTARRVLLHGNFSRGALLAKELRCHNPVVLYSLTKLVLTRVLAISEALIKRQQSIGVGQLEYLVRGFYAGLGHPLDRDHQLFRKCIGHSDTESS